MAFVAVGVFEERIISFAGCVQSKPRMNPTVQEDTEIFDGGKGSRKRRVFTWDLKARTEFARTADDNDNSEDNDVPTVAVAIYDD